MIFLYDLRQENTLHLPPALSIRHGINSLLFRGSFPGKNLPREIKGNLFTEEFKERVKDHGALPCSCLLYK